MKRRRLGTRQRRLAVGILVVAAVYSLTGFLVVPALVKHFVPKLFAEHLDLKVAVQKVRVNPYVLSLRLQQFAAETAEGQPLVTFDDLYVNFQFLQLLRLRFQFEEVSLQGLHGFVRILPDGRFNFSPLIEKLTEDKVRDALPAELPPVFVEDLNIDGARLTFSDLTHSRPFEAHVVPAGFTLKDFSTVAGSGNRFQFQASLAAGGSFSGEGDLSLNPMGARGRVRIKDFAIPAAWVYAQDWVNFEITQGSSDVDLGFEALIDDQGPAITVKNTSVDLKELGITAKGSSDPLLSLPSLTLRGVEADTRHRTIGIDALRTRAARLKGWLNPDGSLGLLSVFALAPFEGREALLSEVAENSDVLIHKWRIKAREILLDDNTLDFEDRTLDPPFRLSLKPIRVEFKNFTNQKDAPTQVSVSVKDEAGGSVTVSGQTTVQPLSADLNVVVDGISLGQFEPYVQTVAAIDLKSGQMHSKGRITYSSENGKRHPKIGFQGRFGVVDLEAVDSAAAQPLFKLPELAVSDIDLALEPNRLSAREVALRRPQAELRIDPAGNLNLKSVLKSDREGIEEIKRSLLGKIARAVLVQIKGPLPFRIDRIRVDDAVVKAADYSFQPPFIMDVGPLRLDVTQIDSAHKAAANVEIDGIVGDGAGLKAGGQVEPFSDDASARMKVSLKNFDVTQVSPYAGRYAGYKLDKGNLSLSLDYTMSKKDFDGTNGIFLQKLTLGERVESPEAVKLPLEMAVALMKDRNDNITLNVPVSGNIDDPHFRIGRVLANALMALITSVAASPFNALGTLAGGTSADELRTVSFQPGSHELDPLEAEQLAQLAIALKQRPTLLLEINATVDKAVDGPALSIGETLSELARKRGEAIQEHLTDRDAVEPERVYVVKKVIETVPTNKPVESVLSLSVP